MSLRQNAALVLLSIVAAYGCAASTDDASDSASESDLILHKGSIDHGGIVEITTMMLASGPTSGQLDPFNQEDPFRIDGAAYAETFSSRLSMFDGADGKEDWQPNEASGWLSRITAGNYLVVDTSKPCDYESPHTYLEIERAELTGKEHQTCGGRMPNEDALDVTINFLVRGPSASVTDADALSDGVDQATKKASNEFPYLGEKNGL